MSRAAKTPKTRSKPSEPPTIQKTERSLEEQMEDIFRNVLKMLSNRKYVQDDQLKPLLDLDNMQLVENEDSEYTVTANNGVEYAIKITMEPGTTYKAGSPIANFAEAYQGRKIYVCGTPASEVVNYGNRNQIQVIDKQFLRFDILEHELQPKFELLSPKEQQLVLKDYAIAKAVLPDMLHSDRVARYFDLPVGAIIRIVRPSAQTGIAVTYRRIVSK